MSVNNQLDITLLQGYLDSLDVDIIQKMLDLYTQQSAVYLEEIRAAITQQSLTDWQESCHKMKGASGSVGLIAVHQQLVILEKSIEDWPIKKAAVAQLTALNDQAKMSFQKWLLTH